MRLPITPMLFAANILAIGSAYAAPCSSTVGLAEAKQLVSYCIQVSTSTRPPCNVQNSCDLIVDEIRRGCDLVRDSNSKLPSFCSPPAPPPPPTNGMVRMQSKTIGLEYTGQWGGTVGPFKRDCDASPESDDGPVMITEDALQMFPIFCAIKSVETTNSSVTVISSCGSEDLQEKPRTLRSDFKLNGDRLTIISGRGSDQVRWDLKQCRR